MKIHSKTIYRRTIKALALSLFFLFSFSTIQAQELEITPTVGYFWGGHVRTYYGEIELGNDMNYGLTIDYSTAPGTQFEISWFISQAKASYFEYGYDFGTDERDLTTNYIHLGVTQEMNYGEAFRPFGTFTLGTTIFDTEENYAVWRFSMALGAGMKYYFNERIGLRAQGRFLLPMYFGGGYYGYYGYGVSTSSAVAQWDVSGGLIIVIR